MALSVREGSPTFFPSIPLFGAWTFRLSVGLFKDYFPTIEGTLRHCFTGKAKKLVIPLSFPFLGSLSLPMVVLAPKKKEIRGRLCK